MKTNNLNTNSIGECIKFFRKRLELSQFDLEVATGLASGSISRIERGIINPTKETLARLGTVLKLTSKEVAYLFQVNLYTKSFGAYEFDDENDS